MPFESPLASVLASTSSHMSLNSTPLTKIYFLISKLELFLSVGLYRLIVVAIFQPVSKKEESKELKAIFLGLECYLQFPFKSSHGLYFGTFTLSSL